MKFVTALLISLATFGTIAPTHADLGDSLTTAMASDTRTDAERARDANRKPIETLTFFGMTQDMHVVELLPGGGWYTKLLAPVLAEHGKLSVAVGTQGIEGMQAAGKLTAVNVLPVDGSKFTRAEGSRRFGMPSLTLDAKNVDMVLTFRNMQHTRLVCGRMFNDIPAKRRCH